LLSGDIADCQLHLRVHLVSRDAGRQLKTLEDLPIKLVLGGILGILLHHCADWVESACAVVLYKLHSQHQHSQVGLASVVVGAAQTKPIGLRLH
jgi:uncharacterized metal-binding protein